MCWYENMSSLVMFRGLCQRLQLCELCVRSSSFSATNLQCKPGPQSNTTSTSQKDYTDEEQHKILHVLNESTTEQLLRYAMSKQRAITLSSFRTKNGKFHSLDQVLRVRSFGQHVLTKLCKSILVDDGNSQDLDKPAKKEARATRSKVQLVVPTLEESRRNNLASAVGIYVGLNVISWANIDRSSNVLTHWDLFRLDANSKKVHPTTVLETVLEARAEIPHADVYVMEDPVPLGQSATQQVLSLSIELHKSQLSAMLLAVLNTTDSPDIHGSADGLRHHRVFYLRSRLSARLFGTLVGSERVSAQTAVQEMLTSDNPPLTVGQQLRRRYASESSVDRENLCQSLLLTLTFMELVVYQNPASIEVVTGR